MAMSYPPGIRTGTFQIIRTLLSGVEFDMLQFIKEVQPQFGNLPITASLAGLVSTSSPIPTSCMTFWWSARRIL